MSHSRERKEKICLNCNAHVHGKYCHVCGQENVEPKESMWGLITHYFYDITHFDGNFFSTLRLLVFKPGFLSREYMAGRRVKYLHPIRMYVFTSALFFIVFFSFFDVKKMNLDNPLNVQKDSSALGRKINEIEGTALQDAITGEDSIRITEAMNSLRRVSGRKSADSASDKKFRLKTNFATTDFGSKEAYDSMQNALPPGQRDGSFTRWRTHKQLELTEKIEKDPRGLLFSWLNAFLHSFPKLLFISLPLFAFLLKLLYIRHRQYYYADHGIFSIHLYIFTFISLLFYLGMLELNSVLHWSWLSLMGLVIGVFILFYTYKAMRYFYPQRRWKTIIKYLLLLFMSFYVILFLFIVFLALSIFQI